jgi:hypothetical protein
VFLLLPLVTTSSRQVRLNKHLVSPGLPAIILTSHACQNDRIFISHLHQPEDGFPNLEELADAAHSDDQDSNYSYSRSPSARRLDMIANRRIDAKVCPAENPLLEKSLTLDRQLIGQLRAQGQATTITPEIRRYLQDVVAFLRMERGVDGGISPYATTVFLALAK